MSSFKFCRIIDFIPKEKKKDFIVTTSDVNRGRVYMGKLGHSKLGVNFQHTKLPMQTFLLINKGALRWFSLVHFKVYSFNAH